jgi:hypothetical protein
MKDVEWKINVDRFSEFSFIKDEIDLLIINNVIDKNKFNYHLVYENEEVSETITSNIELEEGSKFTYNGLIFEVTSKLNNDILAENI